MEHCVQCHTNNGVNGYLRRREETMKTCDVCGVKVKNKEVGHGECPNCFEGLLSDWEKRTKEIWGFK